MSDRFWTRCACSAGIWMLLTSCADVRLISLGSRTNQNGGGTAQAGVGGSASAAGTAGDEVDDHGDSSSSDDGASDHAP